MIYPPVLELPKDTEMISSFGGLDRNIQIAENFFADMKNMSSRHYPLLSTREARGSTGIGAVYAMQICNTYGTREDIGENEIQEDVFALVSEGEGGAVLSFKDENGVEALSPVTIGGDAKSTTLIAQAGYVYAFPQGYRRACFSGGESGPLSNITETKRAKATDSQGLSGSATFEMRPCDADGVADGGAKATATATKEFNSVDTMVRDANDLIIVRANGLSVNAAGTTVKVSREGKVTEKYWGRAETIEIPDGGYALTGHGTRGDWLYNNATIGSNISISGITISVYDASEANSVVYEKPETPFNGLKWYDKATGAKYVYSSAQGEWVAYTTNYILLTYSESSSAGNYEELYDVLYNGQTKTDADGKELRDPFLGFKEGDAIEIKGFSEKQDSSYTIASLSNGGLVLNGVIDDVITRQVTEDAVTISRAVPKMDFVVECGNRLWGCFYGTNEKGEVINEIYASALGDPTNWRRYEGTSMDSWTATVGVDGAFTGAIKFGGYPLFFKENTIIRVYGSAPSSFGLADYNYRGVQAGSHNSLAICDEVLYYLSEDGVMAYNGSVPQKVSSSLGSEAYHGGVAGAIGSKYYLSCRDSLENTQLFVFDSQYGVWHKEDNLSVRQFLRHKTQLYMATEGGVVTAFGKGESVPFEAITGDWGLSNPYRKYFDRFIIRTIVPTGAHLTMYVSYDSGSFKPVHLCQNGIFTVGEITDIPHRCDRIRLKFKGHGDVKIVSVFREISEGEGNVY